MQSLDQTGPTQGEFFYAFKPSLLGAASEFSLTPDGLRYQVGRRSGLVRYEAIGAVRLSYRPVTMQSQRFLTEIWSVGYPKLQIASVSWRSMVEQQRLDAAYTVFVTELHRRLAAAGTAAQFTTGLPVLTYWIGLVLFVAMMAVIAVMLVRSIGFGQWSTSAIVGLFFVVFGYQLGLYFLRNRPGRYRSHDIPPGVLPPAD